MLQLRAEQMEVFRRHERRQLEKRLAAKLAEDLPDETKEVGEEEDLVAFASAQIEKAAGYGITREADVFIYVDRAAWYGDDWDARLDWAKRIFTDERLSGSAKIEDVREYEATKLSEET